MQVFAHHIQDKLAVSLALHSYTWFLAIDAKYSPVKTYNENILSFLEKYMFKMLETIICMFILTLSSFLIYEGRSKILQVHFYFFLVRCMST